MHKQCVPDSLSSSPAQGSGNEASETVLVLTAMLLPYVNLNLTYTYTLINLNANWTTGGTQHET